MSDNLIVLNTTTGKYYGGYCYDSGAIHWTTNPRCAWVYTSQEWAEGRCRMLSCMPQYAMDDFVVLDHNAVLA